MLSMPQKASTACPSMWKQMDFLQESPRYSLYCGRYVACCSGICFSGCFFLFFLTPALSSGLLFLTFLAVSNQSLLWLPVAHENPGSKGTGTVGAPGTECSILDTEDSLGSHQCQLSLILPRASAHVQVKGARCLAHFAGTNDKDLFNNTKWTVCLSYSPGTGLAFNSLKHA